MYNQEPCKLDIQRSTIQDIQKSNYKVANRGSSRITEHITTQRQSLWYFNTIKNSGGKTKGGYGTKKDNLRLIYYV